MAKRKPKTDQKKKGQPDEKDLQGRGPRSRWQNGLAVGTSRIRDGLSFRRSTLVFQLWNTTPSAPA